MKKKLLPRSAVLISVISVSLPVYASVTVDSTELSLEFAPIGKYYYVDEAGYHDSDELYYTGTIQVKTKLSIEGEALLLAEEANPYTGRAEKREEFLYTGDLLVFEAGEGDWPGDERPAVLERIYGVNYFTPVAETDLKIEIGGCEWEEIASQALPLWTPAAEVKEESGATFLLLYDRCIGEDSHEYGVTAVCDGHGILGMDVGVKDSLYFGGGPESLPSYAITFEPIGVAMAEQAEQVECSVSGFDWDVSMTSIPGSQEDMETHSFLVKEVSLQLPEELTGYVLLQCEDTGRIVLAPCTGGDVVQVEEREKIADDLLEGLDEDDYEEACGIVEASMDIQPYTYRIAGYVLPDEKEPFTIEGEINKTWKKLFKEMGGAP